jgi:flagellar motor switch protein FliN
MTDNVKLSQEEIDALLRGDTVPAPEPTANDFALSDEQRDALGELGNISFGSAATSLSTLLQQRVEITTPTVEVIHSSQIQNSFPKPYVMVAVEYTSGIKGSNALAIEMNDAKIIADLMLGGDGTNTSGELNELHLSAVGEAMNQMMGGASTSMSQMFGTMVNISPPTVNVVDFSSGEALELGLSGWIANIQFQLRVGSLIDSRIMQLVPAQFAVEMLSALGISIDGTAGTEGTASNVAPAAEPHVTPPHMVQSVIPPVAEQRTVPPAPVQQNAFSQSAVTAELTYGGQSTSGNMLRQEPGNVVQMPLQRPEFVDFGKEAQISGAPPRNLSLLLDVPLNVTVELGRAKKAIRDILDLTPGAILELDKLAGEPVDILVNNKRIAIGEVVVIDENFGVRVTDIISPTDRLKNIQ